MIDNKLLLAAVAIGGAYLLTRKRRNPSKLDMFQRKRRNDQRSLARGRKEGYSTWEEREDLANSTAAGRRRFAKTGGHRYERKMS